MVQFFLPHSVHVPWLSLVKKLMSFILSLRHSVVRKAVFTHGNFVLSTGWWSADDIQGRRWYPAWMWYWSRSQSFPHSTGRAHQQLRLTRAVLIIIVFISVKTNRSINIQWSYVHTQTPVTQDRNNRFSTVGCQTDGARVRLIVIFNVTRNKPTCKQWK